MATAREFMVATEVKYYVLGGSTNPYLLARVRWPDVAQAITDGCRDWQDDPGLFDLPYEPIGATVTQAEAAAIAVGWGAPLPSDATFSSSLPPLIRRMPANWSNLAPAEKRAWSLEFVPTGRRADASRQSSGRRAGFARRLSRLGPWRTPVTERRHHARVLVIGRAQIRFGPKTVSADLVDISQGGMHCVLRDTQAVVEAGGKLGSILVLKGGAFASQLRLDVGGIVTWHSDTGLGAHFGIAFEPLNDEQGERVQRLLADSGSERRA
jgi:hypothetical protein